MRSALKDKLERIEELFPPERVEASKKRWRALWRGDRPEDRLPFVCAPPTFSYYDDIDGPEERLLKSLDDFIYRGILEDDFVPALFPGCRQDAIPSMFGASTLVAGNDRTCERIVHTPEEVLRLAAPAITPGSTAQAWLDMSRYFLEETEGRLPIHVADMQGPVDAAAQLWGYENLLVGPYSCPDAFDRIMTLSTEAFIGLWKAQAGLAGDLFVGTHLFGWDWAPPGNGVSLSMDSLAMVSQAFVTEHCHPYFRQIHQALGPISIHSCGDFSAVAPAVCAMPEVHAVHAGQMTLAQLLDADMPCDVLAILAAEYDKTSDTVCLARRTELRLDLTVFFPWPRTTSGQPAPQEAWSREDWRTFRNHEQRLLQIMAH